MEPGKPWRARRQKTFTTHAVTAPTATTLAAEGFKETEATLKGTVNPGGEATEYFFEYGTDTDYGQKTEKATLSASGGNQGVSATLKGLTPGTEYHFRLVAKNKQGPAEGLDHSFKTMSPPTKEPTKEPPAKEPSPTPTPTGGNPTATTSTQPSGGWGLHDHDTRLDGPPAAGQPPRDARAGEPPSTVTPCMARSRSPRPTAARAWKSNCSPRAPR